jgi:hypothetical protein
MLLSSMQRLTKNCYRPAAFIFFSLLSIISRNERVFFDEEVESVGVTTGWAGSLFTLPFSNQSTYVFTALVTQVEILAAPLCYSGNLLLLYL